MPPGISSSEVLANYREVMDDIFRVAQQSGRNADDIQLVGVTKYVGVQETQWLIEAGCCDLGESRPQLLWQKAEGISDPKVRWHLIGHLQRNKVARTLQSVDVIHSVDSLRLLQQIIKDGGSIPAGKTVQLLLEINVTSDATKTGLGGEECEKLLEFWADLHHSNAAPANIEVVGLMGMASLDGDEKEARAEFEQIRALRDSFSSKFSLNLPHLSMGMSGDYPSAIPAGATYVRIGSSLFRSRDR